MACQKGIRVMYSSHINIYSRTCDCVSYILNLPCEFLSGLLLLFEFVCPKVLKVLQGPMPSHDQVVRGSPLASFLNSLEIGSVYSLTWPVLLELNCMLAADVLTGSEKSQPLCGLFINQIH